MVKEIVDLLSSENEAPSKSVTSVRPTKNIAKTHENDGFTTLIDEIESTYNFNQEWEVASSKRRKLSPSPISEDDIYTLPTEPRADRISTAYALPVPAESSKGQLWASLDSDPIVFTSSLGSKPPHSKRGPTERPFSSDGLSEDSLPDDMLSARFHSKPSGLSVRTTALLDTLTQGSQREKHPDVRKRSTDVTKKPSKRRSQTLESGKDSSGDEDQDQDATVAKPSKASRKSKLTEEEKLVKTREREKEKALKSKERENAKMASKEKKAKEREGDQERKRLLKEAKAREKRIAADLAEVNKSKLDKKDSTPEMIVDLPASIDGQSVNTQIRHFLRELEIDATLYQSAIPNVVKWRRKMKARWNADLDHWEPIEHMEIHEEKHVICLMSAKDFVALAMGRTEDQDIETHVTRLKSAYDGCAPIYLVEGLLELMRKCKTAENRAYQAKVNSLSHVDGTSSNQPAPKNRKSALEMLDEDLIEDTLLRLQVMHGCLVHHSSNSGETAEWVAHFTQHISTIPYRSVLRLGVSLGC